MDAFLSSFNNREKALTIWIALSLLFIILNKTTRQAVFSLLKSFLSIKVVTPLFLMGIYVSLLVYAACKLSLWEISMLKDTVLWGVGVGFVMFMNYNKATENGYFRVTLLKTLKISVLLEFVINLYVFNFIVELILVPVLTLLTALLAVSETKKEYAPVKKFLNIILALIGFYFLIFAVTNTISDFQHFATITTLKTFLLLPLFTIAYIPCIYLLALYGLYEDLFIRVDFLLKENDKKFKNLTKWRIFRTCLFNLKKLKIFSKDYAVKLMDVKNKSELANLINKFSKDQRSKYRAIYKTIASLFYWVFTLAILLAPLLGLILRYQNQSTQEDLKLLELLIQIYGAFVATLLGVYISLYFSKKQEREKDEKALLGSFKVIWCELDVNEDILDKVHEGLKTMPRNAPSLYEQQSYLIEHAKGLKSKAFYAAMSSGAINLISTHDDIFNDLQQAYYNIELTQNGLNLTLLNYKDLTDKNLVAQNPQIVNAAFKILDLETKKVKRTISMIKKAKKSTFDYLTQKGISFTREEEQE